jgi:selenocysteine lyase/cysteine desulfurase
VRVGIGLYNNDTEIEHFLKQSASWV